MNYVYISYILNLNVSQVICVNLAIVKGGPIYGIPVF